MCEMFDIDEEMY